MKDHPPPLAIGGHPAEDPLAGYAALATVFAVATAASLAGLTRKGRLPRQWSLRDLVMTGVATSRLARIVTRDRIAMPFRAPFTEVEGPAGAGGVQEKPRGRGLRRAVGSLVTCPFCAAPWIATTSLLALAVRPRVTRFVQGMLVSVVIADSVQQAYAALRKVA
jgi:hypothetical protein